MTEQKHEDACGASTSNAVLDGPTNVGSIQAQV